jgi:putative FmdB family regulatory protein
MIYTYECNKCSKRFEGDVKLKDSDKKVNCPRCKREMVKILTPIRFSIK